MNSGTALLARSLRLQARSASPHAARVGLMVLLLLMLLSTGEMWARGGAAGKYVLMQVGWCLALVGTFAGIALFAGAVAEEKEEGNLGLLRMAGLGRTGLLLGVGLARLWDMLLLAACALPAAVLAVTLGGVGLEHVLAVFAALGAWFCCLAGLGLLASTLAATATRAGSLLVAGLLLLQLVPLILLAIVSRSDWDGLQQVLGWWLGNTIWSRLGSLTFSGSGGWWHLQLAIDLGLGLGGMVAAWLLFPRFAQDSEGAGGEVAGPARRWLAIGRPRSGLGAIAWKDFHTELGGWRMFILKLVVAVVIAVLLAAGNHQNTTRWGQAWIAAGLTWVVVETGFHLTRLWSNEIRGKTAAVLLMLPARWPAIAYAKLRVLPMVLLPALMLLAAGVVLAPGRFFEGVGDVLSEAWGWWAITMVLFWWHLCAFLSLRWPRFSLAGSIIVLIGFLIGQGFLTSMVRGRGEGVAMLFMAIFVVAAALMHVRIARMWAARA